MKIVFQMRFIIRVAAVTLLLVVGSSRELLRAQDAAGALSTLKQDTSTTSRRVLDRLRNLEAGVTQVKVDVGHMREDVARIETKFWGLGTGLAAIFLVLLWFLTKLFEVSNGIATLREIARDSAETTRKTSDLSKEVAVLATITATQKEMLKSATDRLDKLNDELRSLRPNQA